MHGLLDLAQSLASDAPFDARMNELCRLLRDLIGCDRSSIFLLEGGYYQAKFNYGNPPDIARLFRVRQELDAGPPTEP